MIPGRTIVVPNGSASEAEASIASICSPSSVIRSANPLPDPGNVNPLRRIERRVPGEIKVRGRAAN
jgi:hypothetical protein